MDHEKQTQPEPPGSEPERVERNPEVEEFFHKLMEKQDIRRPKPGPEAISAALQVIQRLGARIEAQEAASGTSNESMGDGDGGATACSICGHENSSRHQFCGMCGASLADPSAEPRPGAVAGAQHHYHHHYHHHFVAGEDAESLSAFGTRATASAPGAKEVPKLRPAAAGQGLSRAEATIRQMTHDWAAACNNKQIEDLLEFYAADALVMRPNVPPVRGTAAIREFFVGALEAGLGDVEMETLRVELLGDVAYQAGRCKMLVPVVMGKRREERGKYVIVFAKEKSGQWKAVVDSWSTDLGLNVTEPMTGSAAPVIPPKPRR
jgi:ketosteroid isomerase-like protein